MGLPTGTRFRRPKLALEHLEDRLTPANVSEFALPDFAATGLASGDRINVVMAATTTNAADAAALRATPFAADVRALGFGIYSVTLAPGTDLGGAVAYYGRVAGVQSAAPDEVFSVQTTPNDPRYTNGSLYGLNRIGAPTAWNTTTGNRNFVVAVIDSGVDYRHQDLYLNTFLNQREIPASIRANLTDVDADGLITFRDLNNAVNIGAGKITDLNANGYIDGGDVLRPLSQGGWADGVDGNGTAGSANSRVDDLVGWDFANNDNDPFDDNNHGTHVAGTIAGIGNNGIGVAGVNWAAQVMGLKFLTATGSGSTSAAVSALDYAVSMGVRVSNNSWGGGGYSAALDAAIARSRTAGHIFVAAAGNSNTNNDVTPNYPSNYNYDNVVAVAATDSNDVRASFSSYGATTVDLAAPGVGIWSTTPNNGYAAFNGTSMATPHVAGAIALYWGANPSLTYQQVISRLKSSVDVVPALNGVVATGGRLNVAKMFATSPPVASPPVSPPPVTSPPVSPPPVVQPGPKVTTAAFNGTSTQFTGLRVTFDRAVDASTFTAADVGGFTRDGVALSTTYNVVPVGTAGTQFDIVFGTAQTAGGNYALTFGPQIRGAGAGGSLMDQNGNGTGGETADRFTAAGSISSTVSRTYSTGTIAGAIRDFTTLSSTLNVTENLRISDLNVTVNLTHTWVGDLTVTLTSPTVNGAAGRTVTLFRQHGGSGDNLTNTRFDDEATVGIANGAAPFNGAFRVTALTGNLLSNFDGLSTAGAWTLRVTDSFGGDIGTLTNWALVVTGTTGGTGQATAFGFQADDEAVAPAAADPLAFDAAPVAVSGPTAGAAAEFRVVESAPAPTTSSVGAFGLLIDDTDEYAPPADSEADESRDAHEALLADLGADAAPEGDSYAAVLYFAPAAGDGDADLPLADELA